MSISATIGRIGATVLAMARTRLELASVELQEETQRVVGYLALALIATVLGSVALLLAVILVLALFWDTHRLLALSAMIGVFAIGCAITVARLRTGLAQRPPLLSQTLAELRKDAAALHGGSEP